METNNNENNIQENETLDMNHLMQVRREKLDKLREEVDELTGKLL